MIRFPLSLLAAAFVISSSVVFAADEPTSIEDLLDATTGDATVTLPTSDDNSSSALPTTNAKPKQLDIGKTGLPLPRFVSLKRDKVNVRKGPNESFDIAWTYTRKNLPVEIIAEYDNWRKVRDHFGEEGWVFHSLLAGTRFALINPWKTEGFFDIHNERSDTSKIIAKLEVGSLVRIKSCDGNWCQLNIETYQGHMKQELLWGIYSGDNLK